MVLAIGVAFGAGPTHAGDLPFRVCRLVLLEERTELEDVELDLALARSEANAMEQIFKLIDSLWKEEAIERIIFLEAKHNNDVARLAVEEARLRDLREHDVGTRQDVILAEMNVEIAEETLKQTKRRAEACRRPH